MEPILSVVCEEPGGSIERHIYKFVFSEENIKKFWENVKRYPKIFGKDTIGDIEDFLNMFFYVDHNGFWQTNNLFYIVDDFVGTLALTNIYHPTDALMHFTFYDGRLKGRDILIKEVISYVMDEYDFVRLSAEIPCYAPKTTMKFVSDKLGLVLEGKRRDGAYDLYGNLTDVLLYGVTKKDIEKWALQRHKPLVVELQHQ